VFARRHLLVAVKLVPGNGLRMGYAHGCHGHCRFSRAERSGFASQEYIERARAEAAREYREKFGPNGERMLSDSEMAELRASYGI
jgi:hypothetical protein